jgi:predicted XRE-type DNA-binding protein
MPTPTPADDPIPALKARAARELVVLLDGWSQWNASELLRVHQRTISRLRAGQIERYSLEQLLRHLHRLGRAVELTTRRRVVACPGIDHRRVERSGREAAGDCDG